MRAGTWIDGTLSLLLLTAGLALRNCVFVGAAALLGVSGFYRYMDGFKPGQPLRAAGRCIGAGVASIAVAIVMGLTLLTGAFDFWPPVDSLALVAGGLLAMIGMLVRTRFSMYFNSDSAFVPVEVMVAAPATLALGFAANGFGWVACFYAGAALAIAGATGWHLARETASALLHSGAER